MAQIAHWETAVILPGHRECGWRSHDTPACEQPILRQVQQQNLVEPLEGDQEASLTDSCTWFNNRVQLSVRLSVILLSFCGGSLLI
jgi:hypothetical protein